MSVVLLAACSADVDRDDAIAALIVEGSTGAEATCIADTLRVVDRLEIAVSVDSLTDAERDVLLTATTRCRSTNADGTAVLGATVTNPPLPGFDDDSEADPELSTPGGLSSGDGGAPTGLGDDAENRRELEERAREAGIARLLSVGRSQESAECVVDYLIAADATDILTEPDFGVARWPTEADAFAACA